MTLPIDYLTVEITNYCNLKCTMCFKRGLKELPYKHMTLETFIKALDESHVNKGVTFVGLGESLLNPDFFEMLKETTKRGLIINMVTNGVLMNKEFIEKILSLDFDGRNFKISISLDAATKETYDKIRLGGNFNKVIDNITTLVKLKENRKIVIRLDMVLLKSNIHELPLLVQLASDLGVDAVGTLHPQCLIEGLEKEHIVEMNREDVSRYYNEAIELSKRNKITLLLRRLEPKCTSCISPWWNPYLDVYGNVYPCCMMGTIKNTAIEYFKDTPLNLDFSNMIMGNINENNLTDIWNNSKYWSYREECKMIFTQQSIEYKDDNFTMKEYLQLRRDNKDCNNYCKICGLRFGMVC